MKLKINKKIIIPAIIFIVLLCICTTCTFGGFFVYKNNKKTNENLDENVSENLKNNENSEEVQVERGITSSKANSVELKLNLKKGDVFIQNFLTTQTIEQNLTGTIQTTKQNIGIEYKVEVIGISEDGNYKVKYTYSNLMYNINMLGNSIVYDSLNNTKTNTYLDDYYGSLLGNGFEAEINQYNEVISVDGIDELKKSLLDSLSSADPATKSLIKSLVDQQISEEVLTETLKQSSLLFPRTYISPSDYWTSDSEVSAGLYALTNKSKYTVKDIVDGKVILAVESDLTTKDQSSGLGIILTGEQSGTIKIDLESGMIFELNMNQALSGTSQAAGISSPMSIISDIVVKTEKK